MGGTNRGAQTNNSEPVIPHSEILFRWRRDVPQSLILLPAATGCSNLIGSPFVCPRKFSRWERLLIRLQHNPAQNRTYQSGCAFQKGLPGRIAEELRSSFQPAFPANEVPSIMKINWPKLSTRLRLRPSSIFVQPESGFAFSTSPSSNYMLYLIDWQSEKGEWVEWSKIVREACVERFFLFRIEIETQAWIRGNSRWLFRVGGCFGSWMYVEIRGGTRTFSGSCHYPKKKIWNFLMLCFSIMDFRCVSERDRREDYAADIGFTVVMFLATLQSNKESPSDSMRLTVCTAELREKRKVNSEITWPFERWQSNFR